jgi:hypothetical protein
LEVNLLSERKESERNQRRNVAGGAATQAGITFQNRVAAWIAVRILAEQDVSPLWDLPEITTLERLYSETTEPVDDLLVNTSAGGFVFIQVKHRVNLTAQPGSSFASCLDQFVRQFLASTGRSSTVQTSRRPLDISKDRLVLIIGPESSAQLQHTLPNFLRKLRVLSPQQANAAAATSEQEHRVLRILQACIERSWQSCMHVTPSEKDIRQVLSFVHTEMLHVDAGGPAEREALDLLRQVVLRDPTRAQGAWAMLIQTCGEFAMRRSSVDRTYLQELLLSSHIPLQAQRSYREDIERLRAYSQTTVHLLSHEIKLCTGVSEVKIQRSSTDVLRAGAQQTSFLVVGVPGSGKSCALYDLVQDLLDEDRDVVFLAVDHLNAESFGALRQDLNLSHEVPDILAHWPSLEPAFLVIDALDAGKSDRTAQTLRDLMALVMNMDSHWRVIASIRKFDLRYDPDLRNLFAGVPLSGDFQDIEFPRLRHIEIPALSDSELDQVIQQDSALANVFAQGDRTLQEILRVPFNLRVMSELLREGVPLHELTPIRAHIELLDRYWCYRVIGRDSQRGRREQVLHQVVEGMVRTRTLRLEKRHLGEQLSFSPAVEELLKSHVLIEWLPPSQTTVDDSVLAFSHHILFDYAAARLMLRGEPQHVASLLENDSDLVLALRPSLTYHFQDLWSRDKERGAFWQATLYIIRQKHIPEIGKLIGPIIAAESAAHLTDLEPLLSSLNHEDRDIRASTETALGHLIGALAAGQPSLQIVGSTAGPWAAVLERISQSKQRSVVYRSRALLSLLDEQPGALTVEQLRLIGSAARRLLETAWEIQPHDPWLINHAIEGVCRTYDSDREASDGILRRCLELEHVAKYGYLELPRLAREGERLLALAPQFVEDMYGVVFTYEEVREDRTNLDNSRILALASTPRQEYQMAQYQLTELYPAFLRQAPMHALRTLLQLVDRRLSSRYGHAQTEHFDFEGVEAHIIADLSAVWDAGDTYRQDELLKMLDAFDVFFPEFTIKSEQDEERRELLCLLVTQNRYAVLWCHLLLCGCRAPATLGREIRSLAWALPVLTGIDTTTAAGSFLAAVFSELSPVSDEAREEAEHMRDRLLGCLARDAMVTEEARTRTQCLEERGGPPPNIPLIQPFVSWGSPTTEPEDEYQGMRQQLRTFTSKHMRVPPATHEVEEVFPLLLSLQEQLNTDERIKASSRYLAIWGDLVEACERITGWDGFSCVGKIGLFIRSILLQAAIHPEPVPNNIIDGQFDSSPAWGKPAPRIDAAAGLTQLAGYENCATSDVLTAVERLSLDAVPAVRFQVAREVLRLARSAPDLMWMMIEHWAREERSNGVLQGLFIGEVLLRLGWQHPDRVAFLTKAIFDRVNDGDGTEAVRKGCISVFTVLYLRHDQPLSREITIALMEDPCQFFDESWNLLAHLKGAVDLGIATGTLSAQQEAMRQRAWEIIQRLLQSLRIVLLAPGKEAMSDDEQKRAHNALRLANAIALDLCAASGAIEDHQNRPLEERKRFLTELGWLLDALAEFGHPSLAHHLVETLETLIPADPAGVFLRIGNVVRASRAGGYQYESFAADLIVRIVERYLAEFRGVLREHEQCRKTLIELLDSFVEVGWPSARKLTYRLEEIFR